MTRCRKLLIAWCLCIGLTLCSLTLAGAAKTDKRAQPSQQAAQATGSKPDEPSKGKGKTSKLPPQATPTEIEIGKQASKAFEAREELLKDKKLLQKLTAMVERIAAVTERPKFKYTVKVVNRSTPNAFTFPGGYIYLTKGLLDLVESDDELAAVLAHEIAHNVHMHALRAMKKEQRWAPLLITAIVAAAVSDDRIVREIPFMIANLITTVMLGYSLKFEREADESGFEYLRCAGYNPVGMLTVFEKLERIQLQRAGGETPWQTYNATHPMLSDRVHWVKMALRKYGIPLNRRAVTAGGKAVAEEVTINGTKAGAVKVRNYTFCILAPLSDKQPGIERARATAQKLNKLLDAGLRRYEVRAVTDGSKVYIRARNVVIVEVTPQDAALHKSTPKDLADQWLSNLTRIFLVEQLRGSY